MRQDEQLRAGVWKEQRGRYLGDSILFSGKVHLLGREGTAMSGSVEDHLRSFILGEIKLPNDCEIIFWGENSSNSLSGN